MLLACLETELPPQCSCSRRVLGNCGTIASMNDPVLSRYRAEILRIAAEHGASHVRAFGSRARGEGRADSDIDLLLDLEAGRSLLDLIGLEHAIEDLTHLDVDVVTTGGLSPYLRDRVLAEAVPL